MKRLSAVILTLFACSILIFYGCRKFTDSKSEIPVIQSSTVSVIKAWLTSESQKMSINQKKFIDSIFAYANWETAVQQTAANGKQLIYVPLGKYDIGLELFCDEKATRVDSGNIIKTNGIILNEKDMAPHLAVMCYYENIVLKKTSSAQYTGQITTYSLKNNFRYSHTFGKGYLVSMMHRAPANSQKAVVKTNSVNPVKPNWENCDLMGLFAYYADGSVVLISTWYECTPGPGNDPTPPGCLPPSEASINIGTGQQVVIKLNCDDPQGGPGQNQPVVRVWNNISQQCLSQLLNRTMSNVNNLTTSLASTFTPGTGYALNYMSRTIPNPQFPDFSPLTNAYTEPAPGLGSSRWHINVTLNSDSVPLFAQEYAAVTMLHEAIHGFLQVNPSLTFNGANSDHVTMGNNFVTMIADALHSMFPNLSQFDRMALAWGGLEDKLGAAWGAIPENTRTAYKNKRWEYRTGGTLGTRAPLSGNCPQ